MRLTRCKNHHRPVSSVLLIVALLSLATTTGRQGIVHAQSINAEASATWFSKRAVGVTRSFQILMEVVGLRSPPPPEPRRVQLALVGLGRTGSTSFSAALKTLGYKPIHDDERGEVADVYEKMMSGELDLDQVNEVLGKRGFDAPMVSTHDYVKWAATTTNDHVKVILTVRDNPRKWAESWLSVAVPVAFLPWQRPFKWVPMMQQLAAWHNETVIQIPTNGHPELYNNFEALVAGYQEWINFVRATVPAERLLVFNVKEGWEPLCAFLGKEIPDEPFPHINDRIVVDSVVKVVVAITWIWPVLLALPFVVVWYCCFCVNWGRRIKRKDE